ncbi:WD40-repeat-containing domain protein [Rhizophagus diaphanus]|nr:WD40-repeat-containing domain protein [Rhizophagus diaphanus] [Rhizophagus sp. MUCL 43196]
MANTSDIFIAGVKSGQIWEKTEKKKKQTQKDNDYEIEVLIEEKPEGEEEVENVYGLLLNIINAHRPRKNQDKGTINRPVAFGCFCFAPVNQNGNGFQSGFHDGPSMLEEAINGTLLMAAADQRGCVMSFDFGSNKFWQVARLGIAVSTIAFTPLVRSELVVAFTDNSIRCYNIETRQLIAETRSHRNPVNWISMHPKQHWVITSTKSEAILWDMAYWSKQKVLDHNKEGATLRRAAFSPQGEYIISSFFDESICIWDSGSFDLLWKLLTPTRISDQLLSFSNTFDHACRITTMSKDGRIILVAGKKTILVWDFDTKNLIRNISLKSIIEGEITKLEPIHDDADLLVSSSDGRLLIIDIFQSNSQIYHLNVQHPIKFFEISPDGKFIVTNSIEEKAILKIWDLEVLISDTVYIPQNQQAFKEITSKGVDPAIKALLSKNLKSSDSKQRKIIDLLEQLRVFPSLSILGYDRRITIEWIFHMIYPFVELLFDTNETLSFEIILSILFNWYQHYWDEFPNPSTKIMNVISVLLEYWDNELYSHLLSYNIKIQDYAWTMIKCSFARILTREDWLELWDHLLSNEEPSFMYFFLIAYILIARDVLLGMTSKRQVSEFFTRANIVNISKVLEISHKLEKETPLSISPKFDIGRYKPLSKYGKEYKLDYNASLTYHRNQQDDIRDWILEQEKEIIKKRTEGSGIVRRLFPSKV